MLRKNWIQKLISTLTVFAVMSVYTNISFAQAGNFGEITVTGQVSVNGQTAVSASTITSDSKITTGANSGAVISLGANGKVELFSDTSLMLKFTDNSIIAMLTDGKIRVMNAAGIGATVTTKTATVVADTGRANSFLVSLGCADDKDCKETFVETFSGLVVMKGHGDQSTKQVPAGTQAVSADTCSKTCRKPGALLPIALSPGINNGLLAALFGGIGAAIIAAIIIGGGNNPPNTPPTPPVVSPTS